MTRTDSNASPARPFANCGDSFSKPPSMSASTAVAGISRQLNCEKGVPVPAAGAKMASLAAAIAPAARTVPVDCAIYRVGSLPTTGRARSLSARISVARAVIATTVRVFLFMCLTSSDQGVTVTVGGGEPVRQREERRGSAERSGDTEQRVNLSVQVFEP